MPLLTLGFFCLQLDRGNIANAITDNLMEDVGITQDQFNVGQQMLSLGIVLFEIPSNMILYRVGPGKWLTLQLFLFGTVSTFQSFQSSYGSFIACRFLLGMTESGFIPGGLWTLSTWYTRAETAKRVMFFYFGNQARPGLFQAPCLRYPSYARCCRQTWLVLAVCDHGHLYRLQRHHTWLVPTRLVQEPAQHFLAKG
jgi:MFS family permease